MWHLTFKNMFSRKLRLLTTSLAIALGVALFAGAQMLGATINKTFDDLFATVYKNTDVVIQGAKLPADQSGQTRASIDESLVQQIQRVEGVKKVAPYVDGYAQLVKKDGKALATGGAPQVGAAWLGSDSSLNPFRIVSGSAPRSPDQIVIDNGVAKKAKLAVGDSTTVLSQVEPHVFKISGIAKFGTADSPGGAQYVLFENVATAQQYIGEPNKLSSISIVGNGSTSQAQLAQRVRAVVSSSVETLTGKEKTVQDQQQLKKDLGVVTIFLQIFAGVTLFVGAFIINNTFAILVAQRRREMALLRAIGAGRRQVLNSVLVEAFTVGLVASVLGLLLGIGVSQLLKVLFTAFGAELPTGGIVIPAGTVIASVVIGTVITVVSAYLPARRGSKVPPIAAMRDVAFEESHSSLKRATGGLFVLGAGIALIAIGLLVHMKKAYIPVGGGVALTFIGVGILGPIIARPSAFVLGWALPRLKGETGSLARENAMRNPKRTSATAAALMIGVAFVTLASVVFTSLKVSIDNSVDRSFHGDFIIGTSGFGQGGFSQSFAQQLRQQKEIGVVAQERYAGAKINGAAVMVSAIAPRDFTKIANPDVVVGDFDALGIRQVAVSKKAADDKSLTIGQSLNVQFSGAVQAFTVGAIYKDPGPLTDYVVTLPALDQSSTVRLDSYVFVDKAATASVESARHAVDQVTAAYPTAKVQDQTEFKAELSKQINSVLSFFYVLLALAIVIALLGIANTLALSVFERTRELGLLRAVGMTRRQVRSMVRWESVIVSVLGAGLGVIIGVAFGWALVTAAKTSGDLETLAIPFGTLIIIMIVAAVAGVIAAILPARRAARLNILNAIATS